MQTKKLNVKYYILAFIETFSIWQMGIVFYSSKTLTINNIVNTPVALSNSIFYIIVGYLVSILFIYLFPKKTIHLGRIAIISSLFFSILLFFPINPLLFKISYYMLTFCCVFFIGINNSLIINYYDIKTALADGVIVTILSSFFITICQNGFLPLSFKAFNIVSVGCLLLMSIGLLKLPAKFEIKILNKDEKVKLPPKKMIVGLIFIQIITCLSTLFSSTIAEPFKNGVSTTYLGGFISGICFIVLYKKLKLSPFKIIPYYFAVTAIGFLLFLIPTNVIYPALFLQGFNFFIISIVPFLAVNLFEQYPSKLIAPIATLLALITVFISSITIETFRNNPTLLYSIFSFILISGIIIFLMVEKNLELNYYNKKIAFDKLSEREKEVANLLIKGFSLIEISNILFLSTHTVKDYVKSIYKKYQVHSKIELMTLINEKKI